MSKTTKLKFVAREVLDEYYIPDKSSEHEIVKILGGLGNNLHKVKNEVGDEFIASMPNKFRRKIWVKRGDFVVVQPIKEGDKVKAEIIRILYKEQIKYIKSLGLWPSEFNKPHSEDLLQESSLSTNSKIKFDSNQTLQDSFQGNFDLHTIDDNRGDPEK